MFESLLNAFRAPDIRRRILFVLGILVVYRLLAQVPLPGVDRDQLAAFFEENTAFGILDLFAGGGLSQLSIVGLTMNPYINASIIMQLMQGVIPSLQALSREGEFGRQKLNQYTRYLTVPMAFLQAFGILSALSAEEIIIGGFGLGNAMSWVQMVTMVAGAVLLMWLGELITEKGIGNGISFIIFAGIVSQAPGGPLPARAACPSATSSSSPSWRSSRSRSSSTSRKASDGSPSNTPAASAAGACTRAARPSCRSGSTWPA